MKPTEMSSSTMVPVVATLMVVVLQTCSVHSDQIIGAHLDGDIIFPCLDITQKILIAVQWTRPDLTPDLVFFHTEERTHEEHQHPSFKNRVELLDKEMKHGNVSLILRNVRYNDSGTYECRVKMNESSRRNIESSPINIIKLTVTDSDDTDGGNEDKEYRVKHVGLIVGLFVVGLLVVSVLAVIYLKRQRTHSSVPTNPEGPGDL